MNITQIYTHPSRYKPRGTQPPVAIILHEVNEPLGALGARIGTNLINALKPTAHQSYHYALDGAAVHAFVDPAQAARALDDAEVLVDWTPQAGFPGVDPDLYTINIAVIVGSAPIGDNLCIPCCGREYPAITMWNLRRLLHSIAAEYDISLADDMLWLHNDELCDICLDDLRIPPEIVTPGEEDWLCDRLADLPIGDTDPIALVGADCSVYPPGAIVGAGLCEALSDLPASANPQPHMCNTLVVTDACETIPLDDGDWEIYRSGGVCQTGRQTPGNTASGGYSVASGQSTVASGPHSHAQNRQTIASGAESHAEGYQTQATGNASHAEGRGTVASNDDAHAEGRDTLASGHASHAEGRDTIAAGTKSHATGEGSVALGNWSNASGYMTLAAKEASTAQGWMTIADGINSSARGEGTQTKARNAEASGRFAVASLQSEHASADSMFAAVGDSQRRLIHVRDLRAHTFAGFSPLNVWGDAMGIDVEPHAVFNLRAQIVGATEDAAQRWAYNVTACVSKPGPDDADLVVDAQSVTALFESDNEYTADVYANTTTGRVEVRVGRTADGAPYTIRWFAVIEIAQVVFPSTL